MYLSPIQIGIQSAHAQVELFVKYAVDYEKIKDSDELHQLLITWAIHHKTMICLNGGGNSNMLQILELMKSNDNIYPWAEFVESYEAMDSMLTSIAIIVPEKIYISSNEIRNNNLKQLVGLNVFENKLIRTLNSCALAR